MSVPAADCDLAIAGGGLAGLAQAALLRDSGLRVAVLERRAAPAADPRGIALADSSRRLLDAAGLWAGLAARAAPVACIDVSQRGSFGRVRLRAADEGLAAFGWVLAADDLAAALRRAARDAPDCALHEGVAVAGVAAGADAVELELAGAGAPGRLRARLLAVADGAGSGLRERLGLEADTVDRGQAALAARVELDRAADGWAYERFTAAGPLALLPHPDGRRTLVWAQARARARAARWWPEAKFRAELQRALGDRAGRVTGVGSRHVFDLRFRRARARTGPRSVLLGDAAHGFHPVAAQAFNLALRDAAWLAQEARRAVAAGADPGAPEFLQAYARARDADARRVAWFTDLLGQAFLGRNPLLHGLRAAGLFALECLPGLRTRLVRFGMGADLPQPGLARGAGRG